MRPFTKSILELFDGARRYLIPLYQRQYAWRVRPQLELLWEDIARTADRLEQGGGHVAPHFMGAIVIAQLPTFGRQVNAFEVIDGQQRLTTFQLLLTALRDVVAVHSPDYSAEAGRHILNSGIMEKREIERYKLWPSRVDRRALVALIDPSAPPPPQADEISTKYVVRPSVAAHAFFKERIEERLLGQGEFDLFRLDKLFEALKTGLAVVSIELEGGDDPQTIFETLNSRGVELTAADLMRNFIFQRAKGLGQDGDQLKVDDLYERYWLPLDSWFWREGDTRGRLTRPRLDWLLVDHLSMHVAELVPADALYDRYRRWILTSSPFPKIDEELKSIEASAVVHRRLTEQLKSDPLGRFGRFARAFDVSTAMPLVLYLATGGVAEADLPAALAMIESFILRRDICGLTTGSYNKIFVDVVAKLRADNGRLAELQAILASGQGEISRWPTDVEFQRAWLSRTQYKSNRQGRLRYLFEALEERKRTKMSEVVEIKTHLTLEHIMPVKWREHWPLPATAGDEGGMERMDHDIRRDSHIHRLGNLTLLTAALNTTVSNGSFGSKMPHLKAQAALALNRELHAFERWDEEMIDLRGAALFDAARQIWEGPPAASEAE